MKRIEVKVLSHNLNGMAKFLAKLTQRGHMITDMTDVEELYENNINTAPSEFLLTIPHSTIRRMNYITIAVTGLSTKCVSQLRTHATRLTFISTSTQYSSYEGKDDNYIIPDGLLPEDVFVVKEAYKQIQKEYSQLIARGIDKDKASYLLPQGMRKTLIISGNLDAWQYVIKTRLCNRNTEETQYVMRLIYNTIKEKCGEAYVAGMLPSCVNGKCQEGKFSCGKRFEL